MSRTPIATVAGIIFVLVYIGLAISLPDWFGRMHWALEALYWCAAGLLWVLPIRWLMLWAVHKR